MAEQSSKFDLKEWSFCWDCGLTPWHKSGVHDKLVANLDLLTGAKRDKKTFLVPLCGASLDLKHLYDLGHSVVGTEISQKACRQVFEAAKMEFEVVNNLGGDDRFKVFKSKDSRLKLICGNHFELTKELIADHIDCVWDRGALVAIDPKDRNSYVEGMKNLLHGHPFTYLLSSMVYSVPEGEAVDCPPGPPFSLDLEEIQKHFDSICTFRVLDKADPGPLRTSYHLSKSVKEEPQNFDSGNPFDMEKKPFEGYELLVFMKSKEQEEDRIDYWQNRYVTNQSQWHTGNVFWCLEKYHDKLIAGLDNPRILLPLCGKAYDLIWLYEKGHTVVGVEGVHYVAESVFKEHKIKYTSTYLDDIKGQLLKSEDGRLMIYTCDYFDISKDILGGSFNAVFDRGAFGAVNKEDRERYAKLTRSLLAEKHNYLMAVNYYEGTTFEGPPRCIPKELVFEQFGGEGSNVELIESVENTEVAKKRFSTDFGFYTQLIFFIKNN